MSEIIITDYALRCAAAEYRSAMLAGLPKPPECEHEFSAEYIEKRDKLIRRVERIQISRRFAQNAAAIILALVLGSGVFLGINGEARADFFAWLRNAYENSIIYRFAGEESVAPLPDCELTWVPEDYELALNERDNDSVTMVYENKNGDGLIFSCDRITENSLMQIGITTEFTSEIIAGNGYDAELITSEDGSCALIWLDNENGFIYAINGFIDESDIMHIFRSIELTQFTN